MIQMEYCRDGTLADLIQKHQHDPMSMDQVFDLYIQLCRGMKYCHGKNVVHRDLRVSQSLTRKLLNCF